MFAFCQSGIRTHNEAVLRMRSGLTTTAVPTKSTGSGCGTVDSAVASDTRSDLGSNPVIGNAY